MKRTTLILLVMLSRSAISPPGAGAQQVPLAVPRFERSDSVEVRGVEIFDRIICFAASINGSSPYPFVFDTGAGDLSAIDGRAAGSFTKEEIREYQQREGKAVRFTIARGDQMRDVTHPFEEDDFGAETTGWVGY